MIHDSTRRAALAKIHVAKKLLRLSDELYRAIIARVTGGKRSSAALDVAERGRLLEELRRLGFQPKKQPRCLSKTSPCPGDRGRASLQATAKVGRWRLRSESLPGEGIFGTGSGETAPHEPHAAGQARKIRLLWRKLGKAAKLRDASERGLRHFVRRQTGRDALEWLSANEANDVIEGLKAWQRRGAKEN